MSVALWTDDLLGSASCGIDTTYNYPAQSLVASIDRGGVLPGANDPAIGAVTIPDAPSAATVTFDFSTTPGQASFNLATSDVGQYSLSLQDQTLNHSTATITGSSAQLTVRPFGLAVTTIETGAGPTSNPGVSAPGAAVFTSAGSNFSATVSGVLWSMADDGNNDGVLDTGVYANNAVAPSYAWDSTLAVSAAGFTPATGAPGNLNNGAVLLAEFGGGSATVSDLQYTEVGSFTLQATATDFLGVTSADIVGDDIVVGRFTPASFNVSIDGDGSLGEGCGVFTYIGQDFGYATAPTFTVTARNALGATTSQYRDAFVKLSATSVSADAIQDDTTPGSDAAALLVSYTADVMSFAPNNDGTVAYTFGADVFRYGPDTPIAFSKFANSQVTPFVADINPEISAVNDGEVSTSYAAGTHVLDPTGNNLRFGRLRMDNVHGSELNPLLMPVFTEYWNGFSFQRNTLDTCTVIDATNLLSGASPLSVPAVANTPAAAGDVNYSYPAPGAGNVGFIDTQTDLSAAAHLWLRYDWLANGEFDDDPAARATFGIFDGDPVQIYIQQIFN
jgi:hypothetical protein